MVTSRIWILLIAWYLPQMAVAAPLPTSEIAPGIYVHQGRHEDIDSGYSGDICNIGFIIGSKGVAVIDSGGSLNVGEQLLQAIRQFTDLPVLYVINTHVHPDHVFGNAAFLGEKPVFVGHHKLAAAMAQREDAYLKGQQRWLGDQGSGSRLIPPTLAVEKTQQLDLGDRTLVLTAYPTAHTNTDLTIFDEKTGALWTGDLLFIERTPSIDGDILGWLRVLADMKSLPAQITVPGHGPVTHDLPGALAQEHRYLATLLADVRAAIKRGDTMQHTMDTAAQSEQSAWQLFDIINRRNVNLIFPILEWE